MHSQKTKVVFSRHKVFPFVCLSLPFVCQSNPRNVPLVSSNKPFVGSWGFTLIEMIITITIAGILMAVAAPNMFTFVASNRLASQVNDLINGWLVYYVDPITAANVTLKLHGQLTGNNTLTAPAPVLTFNKSGFLTSAAGNFTLCDGKLKKSRILNIPVTGRPALTENTC
ncbi:MAG: GspH/FimT family pseudopilin [Gammaproteobacteria bacterium]|nr:GspH/FimT family pseudopilin [Gammaproteobacteria bacterium]